MQDRNLTSANSVFTMQVDGLFPAPVVIEGYSTDRAFEAAPVETGEVQMGVDGKMSAGWIPNPIPLDVFLQATSKSNDYFEQIDAAETAQRTKLKIRAVISIPSLGKQYTFQKGYLVKVPRLPNAGKVLQPRNYQIMFERAEVSNI